MKIWFFLSLIGFILSCQTQSAQRDVVYENKGATDHNNIVKIQEKTNDDEDVISKSTLKCDDKAFTLVVEYKNNSKSVKITEGDTTIKTINLPNQPDVNGFSLNWAKETKEGFEISIEYGSRLYYQKDFSFICKQNTFYLSKLKITTFDKHDPENSWKERDTIIKPELPLEKFLINDFIGND